MASILITRPQATASALAERLQSLGYQAVIEPLLEIVPTGAPKPQIKDIAAVMITSGNALDALAADQTALAALADFPCFCVGPRTGEKARALGFKHVESAASDGAALAILVDASLPKTSGAILHVAAQDADSKAQQEVERKSRRVIVWQAYRAIPAGNFSAGIAGALMQGEFDAILVFSPRTAGTLGQLIARHGLKTCCARLTAICLSEAVAEPLKPFGWQKLVFAAAPTEDAVIARLQEIIFA